MYSTRNKKCMLKLAKKDFLKNRTRNIVAVLAMILTTVLFTVCDMEDKKKDGI